MSTTSQTSVSSSTSMSPARLLDELVSRLHGAADVQRDDGRLTLLFPAEGRPVGSAPVGSVHITPGLQTLLLDVVAETNQDLQRLQEIIGLRIRNVDAAAGGALVWRRHD